MATGIDIQSVTKTYSRGGETLRVLDELELGMAGGTFYALMGPSGSGKTTLLNLIGGLDHADTGSIVVGDTRIENLDGSDLAQWRAENVGFIFQGFNLLPVLSARENVELPLLLAPLSGKQRREQAERALELVGLTDRMTHKPKELSGGQEQRVAIARAIASDPAVILADEPTGDLDRDTADSILELMQRLNKELQKTILMVTHDPQAATYADQTIHLDKGKLGHIEDNRTAATGS
ncbi:MAG: ABC transporter ATP-binding protein [bacterium]|nr:ABC transporter ATP-binding protein [bacterium]